MENASNALKMAFAILVFIVALSILFSLMMTITATSETVLFYSDSTNFYDWEDGTKRTKRIVGEDTVIARILDNSSNVTVMKDGRQIYPNDSQEARSIVKKELSER